MANIIEQLENWVKENYNADACEYTYERSEGNSPDCFEDGFECGISLAAFEVGKILGMNIEYPDERLGQLIIDYLMDEKNMF